LGRRKYVISKSLLQQWPLQTILTVYIVIANVLTNLCFHQMCCQNFQVSSSSLSRWGGWGGKSSLQNCVPLIGLKGLSDRQQQVTSPWLDWSAGVCLHVCVSSLISIAGRTDRKNSMRHTFPYDRIRTAWTVWTQNKNFDDQRRPQISVAAAGAEVDNFENKDPFQKNPPSLSLSLSLSLSFKEAYCVLFLEELWQCCSLLLFPEHVGFCLKCCKKVLQKEIIMRERASSDRRVYSA
jgi:hypothetical protein